MTHLLNQIQTWLKLPKFWRFVGFASALLGLLCFALSSSFNSLLGEWNLLKIFLYVVLCFIICIAVLFANVWQPSSSLRLEAHLAFLVLTITSFYSFFLDKAVKGKPDAYSIVSCAAFAVMSLSLSQQTHFGFEVDLLYFFLGTLIVQLMKIKWLLGIAGAGFSYFLVILRSRLDVLRKANTCTELQDLSRVIIQVDSLQLQSSASSASALLVTPQGRNAQEHAIGEGDLHQGEVSNVGALVTSQEGNTQDRAIPEVDPHSSKEVISADLAFNEVGSLQSQLQEGDTQDHAITKVDSHSQQASIDDIALIKPQLLASLDALRERNQQLISWLRIRIPVKNLLSDHNSEIDRLPREVIKNLNEAVKLAVGAGLEKEFCHLYSLCRMEFLGQFLATLELEDLNDIDEEQWDWASTWIEAFEVAVKVLFPIERRLCDRVFLGFYSAGDHSFVLVCKEVATDLLNMANTFTAETRSPKILFGAVEVLTKMRDMFPELESLFPGQFGLSLLNEAIRVGKRLGDAIRNTLMDLGDLIICDNTIARGGIWWSTWDKVLRLIRVMEAATISELAFSESPMVTDDREEVSPFSAKFAAIMKLFEGDLEAEICTETAFGLVTVMNHIMYIKEVVMDYEVKLSRRLHRVCSYEQVRKITAKVRQRSEDYLRIFWKGMLGFLELDSNDGSVPPDLAAESMKEKLRMFNIKFDDICRIQPKWFARDDIRRETMMSIKDMLLPAYGNFVGRFQDLLGENANEYIHYGMSDIEDQLNHLFLGGKPMNP